MVLGMKLKIDKKIPPPVAKCGLPEIRNAAKAMRKGDSVGNLTHYYSWKLRSCLGARGISVASKKESNGLYRVWHIGEKQ